MISKDIIRDRLKVKQKWITTSPTNIFNDDVPEGKIRYIVKIVLTGDQQSTRIVDIYKVKEDDTLENWILNITLGAPEYKEIPEGSYDIENPIKVLEGGTNLAAKVSGNSISMTVWYWDNDI